MAYPIIADPGTYPDSILPGNTLNVEEILTLVGSTWDYVNFWVGCSVVPSGGYYSVFDFPLKHVEGPVGTLFFPRLEWSERLDIDYGIYDLVIACWRDEDTYTYGGRRFVEDGAEPIARVYWTNEFTVYRDLDMATLTVSTIPAGARIYIDSGYYGNSPQDIFVSYGTHQIKLSYDGYRDIEEPVNVSSPILERTWTLSATEELCDTEGATKCIDGYINVCEGGEWIATSNTCGGNDLMMYFLIGVGAVALFAVGMSLRGGK